ncbi:DUF551 domain-containing protein [Enterobacter bugandensis]
MITLTKEWLLKTIAELEEERDAVPGVVNVDVAIALAAMKLALASLEAEAVCVIDQSNLDYLKSGSDADVWPASRTEMGDVLLYRSAPPAPVSVPDEGLLHMAASAIEDLLSSKDRSGAGVWADLPAKLRRAAMLKHSEPFIVTSDHRMMEMPQVEAINAVTAMLQGAEPVSNRDELTDGWVACSERLPDIGTEIFYFCQDDGLRDCGIVSSSNFSGKGDAELYVHAEGYDLRFGVDISHWMPLPAAPQHEVKP